ncbi:MAG: tRNA (adenosine(37)-N6)-threonylcarbamoyltransferase complex ATPase subunit type 1 TsaE [Bacteroidales bacterium]|jgi:tRNA threonylcarbamoyladenosine biosynthesis protein TsaE|nr:tRNA (adenosine(37)-N6)-threonylcarbamoyltransferase complex ATPase subunit type 1 TsaE [Bacteroidales bacterium]
MPPYVITASLSQLDELAKKILEIHSNHRFFCLNGEMGSGKTTLIKALCKCLGVQNITSSPTFAIVNEYWTLKMEPVYHFDFYRIERPEEAIAIGFFEYLESGNYCFVEWSEKIEEILDEERVQITIEQMDEQIRKYIF